MGTRNYEMALHKVHRNYEDKRARKDQPTSGKPEVQQATEFF